MPFPLIDDQPTNHRQPVDEATVGWVLQSLGGCDTTLSVSDRQSFGGALEQLSVKRRSTIFCAGGPSTHVYIIESGTVELRRPFGSRQTIIETLDAGSVVGDVPILLGRTHHVEAVAANKVTLLAIARESFLHLLRTVPALMHLWLPSLAGRIYESRERLGGLLAGHLDHRTAALLLRRTDQSDQISITQEQLAGLLGVQRSSISDAIRRLELRGFVQQGYGQITVLDREGLRGLLGP